MCLNVCLCQVCDGLTIFSGWFPAWCQMHAGKGNTTCLGLRCKGKLKNLFFLLLKLFWENLCVNTYVSRYCFWIFFAWICHHILSRNYDQQIQSHNYKTGLLISNERVCLLPLESKHHLLSNRYSLTHFENIRSVS